MGITGLARSSVRILLLPAGAQRVHRTSRTGHTRIRAASLGAEPDPQPNFCSRGPGAGPPRGKNGRGPLQDPHIFAEPVFSPAQPRQLPPARGGQPAAIAGPRIPPRLADPYPDGYLRQV